MAKSKAQKTLDNLQKNIAQGVESGGICIDAICNICEHIEKLYDQDDCFERYCCPCSFKFNNSTKGE